MVSSHHTMKKLDLSRVQNLKKLLAQQISSQLPFLIRESRLDIQPHCLSIAQTINEYGNKSPSRVIKITPAPTPC